MNFKIQDEMYVKNKMSFLLNNEKVQSMKQFTQHGNVNTYEHCVNVAIMSYIIAKYVNWDVDMDTLLTGAILHDFYLYDWHDGRKRQEGLHCFSHPRVALCNASRYFLLTKKEKNIIRSHMFPATIFHPPTSKEALIVVMADKICATKETFEIGFLRKIFLFLFKKDLLGRRMISS